MKSEVSKARTRRARNRLRKSDRNRSPLSWRERPGVGLLIGVCLWAIGVFAIGFENILFNRWSESEAFPLVAHSAILLVGLIAAALFLQVTATNRVRNNAILLLLAVVSVIAVLLGRLTLHAGQSVVMLPLELTIFLLPVALAPLLVTILINGTTAVIIGLWCSLCLSLIADSSLAAFLSGVVASVMAARCARNVRRRSSVFRTGAVIGLAQTVCVFTLTALMWEEQTNIMMIVYQAGACILSGFTAAALTILLLPLFESVFGITTDITLLEISDLGHPLLQRLAIEAPGTYHHSLVVASLAQAAAGEVGANGLLARVCSYYHDIGKLTKPDFFAENIHMKSNPHDELSPSMSTLIITSHVKEGLSLALLHKLPTPIKDVICEHHGTSVISCFHHKAKNLLKEEQIHQGENGPAGRARLNEEDFRYTGPRPSSKESGIICLADSVEAASRSLEKTTPGHLDNLVGDIIFKKLKDGQLDDSPLTMNELRLIRRSFVFTLTNMLHGRIAYPKDEDSDKQPAKAAPGAESGGESTAPNANPKAAETRPGNELG